MPQSGTQTTVAVDASSRVSPHDGPSHDQGTDPKTQDKSIEAWKRDEENQTSLHSYKAKSESGTYQTKNEATQNQDNVINDFDSSVVVRNTNAAKSQHGSGRLHKILKVQSRSHRPQVAPINKRSQTCLAMDRQSQTASQLLQKDKEQIKQAVAQAQSLIRQANEIDLSLQE